MPKSADLPRLRRVVVALRRVPYLGLTSRWKAAKEVGEEEKRRQCTEKNIPRHLGHPTTPPCPRRLGVWDQDAEQLWAQAQQVRG